MPTYEYQCESCGGTLEVFHGFNDPPPTKCTACGAEGTLRKLISAGGGVIFRGSGFYATDYKSNGGGERKTPEKQSQEKPPVSCSSGECSTCPMKDD